MEVEVVEAEALKGFLRVGDRLSDRLAYLAFVLVIDRCIEQAVADGVNGVDDGINAIVSLHRVGPEAELWDRVPIVEAESGDGCVPCGVFL